MSGKSKLQVEVDCRYINAYDLFADLFKSCDGWAEIRGILQFHFLYPVSDRFHEIVDALSYFEIPFYYHRELLFGECQNYIFLEISRETVWKFLFGHFDDRKSVILGFVTTPKLRTSRSRWQKTSQRY